MKIKKNGAWEDFILPVSVPTMKGASDTSDGTKGLVPAPAAGMQNKFLCSDATWKDAGGLPVGHEFFTTNPNIPAGCIPLLGGEYSRTAYADLWAWVQTQQGYLIEESAWQAKAAANGGNVPFYSSGDGSTTFRVPSLKCWVKGANGIEEVGSYLSAGLPNITGETWAILCTYGDVSADYGRGALHLMSPIRQNSSVVEGNGNDNACALDFDASKSNSIYGNSTTVQPPSIVGMWLVKAYGTVTNVGSTDVANIAQGLTELETRVVPIEKGGTGATTASQACANIGALPTSGGTITGQIQSAGNSTSWVTGRNVAPFKTNSCGSDSYCPVISAKTVSGSWELGPYTDNILHLSYITDANFNAGTNKQTADFGFTTDKNITGVNRIVFTNGAQFWIA